MYSVPHDIIEYFCPCSENISKKKIASPDITVAAESGVQY
jgi:hypothetical protein